MPRPLREIRAAQGHTQESLAKRVGVSYLSVSNWENLYSRPRDRHVEKLSEVLGVPSDEIELAPKQPVKAGGRSPGWSHTPETKALISQRVKEARYGQNGHRAVASGEAA